MAAEGFRIWSLPEPGESGLSDTDMLLMAVGVAFYETKADSPRQQGGRGGTRPFSSRQSVETKKRDTDAFIIRDDEEAMELVKIMFLILLES